METILLNSPGNDSFPTLIRCKKVCGETSLSRSYVYQLSREGRFPKPVSLVPGGTSVAWVASEVDAWVNERITERNKEA